MGLQNRLENGTVSNSITLIAIIDDDAHVLKATARLLAMQDFEIQTFPTAEAFLEWPRIACTSCVICDLRLPGMHGSELLQTLRMQGFAIPIIFISAHHQDIASRPEASDAACILKKPFDASELTVCINRALKLRD
ncbi:response regulator transcription factor [Martelella radicis]|uniref:FixJ family two-component response regulator n=1 Tax=Martelella radicis TaxID=1397476 RepID=A0A7W6P944_9HYPH|nr:response regulator [Martelella radicis]MBB4120159.1 FixJ family two-component response regulator [Martelella radicis]